VWKKGDLFARNDRRALLQSMSSTVIERRDEHMYLTLMNNFLAISVVTMQPRNRFCIKLFSEK
jgi:hypothetical protein